jgi:hypothetical protein
MVRCLRSIVLAAFAAFAIAGATQPAKADFTELLSNLPSSSNTLVMLNAEKIFASEVATRGGWKQRYDATYSDAPLLLPPGAQQFVLAADLELPDLTPRSEVAVMRLTDDVSMGLIARHVRGNPDEVAGLETVSTPKGATIVKFAPYVFGLIKPGSRQQVAQWIRSAESASTPSLSPYLSEAASVPDRVGTEIIMAIDLTDALRHESVREALGKSPVLRENSVDVDAAADVIMSIRGMTLGARVGKRVYGVLKIDFGREVGVLSGVAQPLLVEVLQEAGASIDEFATWKPVAAGRRITLEGELTEDGMRRLFSFLELDATAVDAPKDTDSSESGALAPKVDAYASQQYFQAVTLYLNDLKRERGASTYYSIATWFDKYARRIDRLPILHVDKDLVDYGQYVVSQLRNCVEAIRGAGISSGARSAQVTSGAYGLFSSPASYARADVSVAEQERRAIRAQEQGQSSTDVRAIIRQIQENTSKIRRLMTERYNIEFEANPRRTETP